MLRSDSGADSHVPAVARAIMVTSPPGGSRRTARADRLRRHVVIELDDNPEGGYNECCRRGINECCRRGIECVTC